MIRKSDLEEKLAWHLRAIKEKPVTEYKFHPKRRWRFDFAFIDEKLAIEVEGLTFYGKNKDGSMKLGRHQTGKGAQGDMIKYDAAMQLGWTIYRCEQSLIESGRALQTIEILLNELRNKKMPGVPEDIPKIPPKEDEPKKDKPAEHDDD